MGSAIRFREFIQFQYHDYFAGLAVFAMLAIVFPHADHQGLAPTGIALLLCIPIWLLRSTPPVAWAGLAILNCLLAGTAIGMMAQTAVFDWISRSGLYREANNAPLFIFIVGMANLVLLLNPVALFKYRVDLVPAESLRIFLFVFLSLPLIVMALQATVTL